MAEKKERGSFKLSHEELSSREMVLITFTLLESRGYPGLTELFSILEDPTISSLWSSKLKMYPFEWYPSVVYPLSWKHS